MWDMPYNFHFYKNKLAVGIIYSEHYSSGTTYWMLTSNPENDAFDRRKYQNDFRHVQYCNYGVCVRGIMGSSHKSKAKIEVYPENFNNLADSVKNKS